MNSVLKNLKKSFVITVSFFLFGMAAQLSAHCGDTLEHRIAPIGKVCVEGEECIEAVAVVAEAPKGPRAGSEIVGDYCSGCHATGVMNAPKIGGSFKALASKGVPELLKVTNKGKNAMPRKGGCNDCSDEELTAAIQHMLNQ